MSGPIGEHTHVLEAPRVRTDVAPSPLVHRFGSRWWFAACDVCGDARMCPAQADLASIPPEVPYDWLRWRERPDDFEITQPAAARG